MAYASALIEEIKSRKDEILTSSKINTLYFGGGTPSVLPLCVFRSVVEALDEVLGESGSHHVYDEFTVEVNPEDVVSEGLEYLTGLRGLGVNRISMGIQSFDDGILKWMNRRHSAQQARQAYELLVAAGFENISIDLIFGLSHIDDQTWLETIDEALSWEKVTHISAYQLSIEPDSALDKLVQRGLYTEADQEQCAHQYDMLCERLSLAGFTHYEISNFARPGFEAKHNSAYWDHYPYVGLGPGAHSYKEQSGDDPHFVREWNADNLAAYLAGEEVKDGETLDGEQLILERIMLGLRTAKGVPYSLLEANCDPSTLKHMLEIKNLETVEDETPDLQTTFIRIPENKFFISDSIIAYLA
jgi:oxygen-independent coproporphyrinogen-3 oxidase